jgi:hypothetical protein
MSLLPRRSVLRTIWVVIVGALTFTCMPWAVAFAQRGGGQAGGAHFGGGHFSGGHFNGGGHVGAPRGGLVSPRSHIMISPPRFSGAPPLAGFGTRSFFPRRPIRPLPPIFPIFRRPIFFGSPFFSFGLSLGFNNLWWPNCGPFWGWGFGCNSLPFFGYGFGNYGYYGPSYPSGPQPYVSPPASFPNYIYGQGTRQLVELYLKDGTIYEVTDYWLVNDQLHFRTAEEGGTKLVEHVIDFDQLDLQKTIDVNTDRGFRFVLRNEPLEDYLRDHPDIGPNGTPSQTGPAGPLQPVPPSQAPQQPQQP